MTYRISYGQGRSLELQPAEEKVVANCTTIAGEPLDDPAAAVAASLADPIDFPPLSAATIVGDRVVIALDSGVPQAAAVVAGLVLTLLEGDCEPSDLTIVTRSPGDAQTDLQLLRYLPPEVRAEIQMEAHDPIDQDRLSYLAAAKNGKPIYFNRTICEADVVLPVSSLRLDESVGYFGVFGGLFPAFSDEATRQRFSTPDSVASTKQRQRRCAEAAEAAWLLGVQFTVQVVPGPGDTIMHVLAGDAQAVGQQGRSLCERAWSYKVPRRANLVVASIEGGPEQQTWDNLARALTCAAQVVSDDGAIVLCTDLRCAPGPALLRLSTPETGENVRHAIQSEKSPDALPAAVLLDARERAHVYLLSGLDRELVEDLGIAPVINEDEIDRIAQQYESCIFLANAHHAVPLMA